jgi:HNH endonuclease
MSGARYVDLSARLIANSVIIVGGKLTRGSECWDWLGYRDRKKGYGKLSVWNSLLQRAQSLWVHRVAYEWFKEELIPPGFEVDHLCRNTSCINPGHFELVSKIENISRMYAASLTEKIYDISGYIEALDSDYEGRALSHAGWVEVQHVPRGAEALVT